MNNQKKTRKITLGTITRRDDGTLRPNFKPMKVDGDFSIERYAVGVSNELLWALEGLVEKR